MFFHILHGCEIHAISTMDFVLRSPLIEFERFNSIMLLLQAMGRGEFSYSQPKLILFSVHVYVCNQYCLDESTRATRSL